MSKPRRDNSKTKLQQLPRNSVQNVLTKRLPAKKSLGQNFLVDQNYIDKIVDELNPQPHEIILEIGPGRGALTARLIESQAEVIAVEIDRNLIPVLQNQFQTKENFKLIEADVLSLDFAGLQQNPASSQKFKIVANLPYYISTAILTKIIDERARFSEAILMLQKEVAERIVAAPGNSERGYLSVLTQAFANVEKLFDVPPSAFSPQPKIWSSIVKITFANQNEEIRDIPDQDFLRIVGLGFAQKRKTILNNLANAKFKGKNENLRKDKLINVLNQAHVDINRRAESLTLDEWDRLAKLLLVENG